MRTCTTCSSANSRVRLLAVTLALLLPAAALFSLCVGASGTSLTQIILGNVEMLQDAIMAAVNEAMRTADSEAANNMSRLTGGLNLGGLF